MAPSSQEMEPPEKPARFRARIIKKLGKVVSEAVLDAIGEVPSRRRPSQSCLRRAEAAIKRYYGDQTERALRRAARMARPHANYFKGINRGIEEMAVVADLIKSIGPASPLAALTDLRLAKPDPPDVIGRRPDGALVAVEVTELVDKKVTKRNVEAARATAGQDWLTRMKATVRRVWEKAGVIAAVEHLLRRKDSKTLHGGPFAEYIVVIHTDEYMLEHDEAEQWLRGHTFAGMRQVTEAYLLFSYVPAMDGHLNIRLDVGR